MQFPFLMSRENFGYTYNTEANRKIGGEKFIPITAEQAKDLSVRGEAAGVEILRAVVAADRERALAEAEARLAATSAPPPASIDLTAAEPEQAAAEAEPERPWDAKPIKGNPPKKDLIAFLEAKGVSDAASLSYDELKTTAASYDWNAEHGA